MLRSFCSKEREKKKTGAVLIVFQSAAHYYYIDRNEPGEWFNECKYFDKWYWKYDDYFSESVGSEVGIEIRGFLTSWLLSIGEGMAFRDWGRGGKQWLMMKSPLSKRFSDSLGQGGLKALGVDHLINSCSSASLWFWE